MKNTFQKKKKNSHMLPVGFRVLRKEISKNIFKLKKKFSHVSRGIPAKNVCSGEVQPASFAQYTKRLSHGGSPELELASATISRRPSHAVCHVP